MQNNILIAGVGGSGKTTVASFFARYAVENAVSSLVVDADPDQTLHMLLGIPEPQATLAHLQEMGFSAGQIRSSGLSAGELYKQRLLNQNAIQPIGENVDFVAMGSNSGRGCFCAANQALRDAFEFLHDNYYQVIFDYPGGREGLSRFNILHVSKLVLVSRPDKVSRQRAEKLLETAIESGLETESIIEVVNMDSSTGRSNLTQKSASNWQVSIPYNDDIQKMLEADRPIFSVSSENAVMRAVDQIIQI